MIIGEILLQISSKNNSANITEVFEKSHRKNHTFWTTKMRRKNPAKLLFYGKSCVF